MTWIQDGPVGPCRKILPSCSVEASPSKAMVIKTYCCNAKAEEKVVPILQAQVAYSNARTVKDVGVQALTMRELRKCNTNVLFVGAIKQRMVTPRSKSLTQNPATHKNKSENPFFCVVQFPGFARFFFLPLGVVFFIRFLTGDATEQMKATRPVFTSA